jgi:hypothetical protein
MRLLLHDHVREETRPADRWVGWLLVLALTVLGVLWLAGCTVRPVAVEASLPSFDGGQLNSGFLGYTSNRLGVLTPHGYGRYNALIGQYGNRFAPPLAPGAGCKPHTNGTWLIDAQHEVYFKTMNRWRKNGK